MVLKGGYKCPTNDVKKLGIMLTTFGRKTGQKKWIKMGQKIGPKN